MTTRWEKYWEDKQDFVFLLATVIEDAFDDLAEQECPYCHRQLELPSLEDIQEWLKEEK